jgi:hypothetical protein
MAGAAATRVFAAGGAGGIALTAWAMSRFGMGRRELVRSLTTFYVALYSVYVTPARPSASFNTPASMSTTATVTASTTGVLRSTARPGSRPSAGASRAARQPARPPYPAAAIPANLQRACRARTGAGPPGTRAPARPPRRDRRRGPGLAGREHPAARPTISATAVVRPGSSRRSPAYAATVASPTKPAATPTRATPPTRWARPPSMATSANVRMPAGARPWRPCAVRARRRESARSRAPPRGQARPAPPWPPSATRSGPRAALVLAQPRQLQPGDGRRRSHDGGERDVDAR